MKDNQQYIQPSDANELFGNDAAELEEDEIFNSYALDRAEIVKLVNHNAKICIVNAYKGTGKSALLRMVKNKIKTNNDRISIFVSSPEISPVVDSWDTDVHTREWKKAILKYLAGEIGRNINMAWTDDATALVEMAEANGFKQRSFVGYVAERLAPGKEVRKTPIDGDDKIQRRMERWIQAKQVPLWLIIDDIDQNFENNKNYKLKVVGFLNACRSLSALLPNLRIRFAIRPNVWKIVKQEFESLSHLEQYMVELDWQEADIRMLLAKRIQGYMERNGIKKTWPNTVSKKEDEEAYISIVFDGNMKWNDSTRPPHVILDTLSKNRPRWLIELCKISWNRARKRDSYRINLGDITADLKKFGGKRVDDTIAEFKSQCLEIAELLSAFKSSEKTFNSEQLFALINKKIIQHLTPHITGVAGKPSAQDVAFFLFQIGFISARKELENGKYEHVTFSDDASILSSRANPVSGYSWEIHPIFVHALDMKNERPVSGIRVKRR